MGGGKSQKGGKHGFIGRTLAHDILARQAKQDDLMLGDRPYRPVEHSVVERKSLDEFTLAAEHGLETYLSTRGGTREVLASDFNTQLARMVDYSESKDDRVFPAVPIPRRCLFFDDEQRETIAKLIKQREHAQHLKEKRVNKRRNKKLVDMYMHGSGPKPVNGIFDPLKLRTKMKNASHGNVVGSGSDSEDLSDFDLEDDEEGEEEPGYATDEEDEGAEGSEGSSECDSEVSEDSSEDSEDEGANDAARTPMSPARSKRSVRFAEPLRSPAGAPKWRRQPTGIALKSGRMNTFKARANMAKRTSQDDYSSEEDEDDDISDEYYSDDDVEEEEDEDEDEDGIDEGEDEDEDEDDSGFETEEIVETPPPEAALPARAESCGVKVSESQPNENVKVKQVARDLKYVKEYKTAIEHEVSSVDICKMDANELNRIETKCFYTWRKLLAQIEDEEERVVTPYEKNIEFWRQLWRVIERSHILLIIIDARDPLFYRVPDLESYVKEVDSRKEMMLILNKADYLTLELRKAWAEYFKSQGIDFVFFSTIWGKNDKPHAGAEQQQEDPCCKVYNVAMLLEKINGYRQRQSAVFSELNDADNAEIPLYTVGFVGYPNVGKSSLINCLMEATKTNVSCQPGKTKHLQTLPLKKENITLCDCPGLIFPNIVSTKHHLLINGIVATAHFRGSLIFAVQLICNRIPKQLCERYDVDRAECVILGRDSKPILFSQKFLEFICHSRKFYSGGKGGQPDLGRAAKLVVKDYVSGSLLYCAWPPTCRQTMVEFEAEQTRDLAESLSNLNIAGKGTSRLNNDMKVSSEVKREESKLQEWLLATGEDIPEAKEKPMTKRKMRFLIKGKRKSDKKKTVEPYA
ncbi:GTPase subfamily protein, putative [Babesia bigemina]|uniref:GTPase subfamily protein, putative n=1 Tax=Babesia bigemina TaxID=5866 RepID=A0A061D344_BABBI|nr:GTPase subfamily protein, putative [Babesia bigemina]CDR94517.1 GTPase subfamily protein, putative [Babesia bigemina]|eukprot:XP_012766703.1 GTPase subfamily protein, putative [Babesia bigemina]